jgi:hypothetical protein
MRERGSSPGVETTLFGETSLVPLDVIDRDFLMAPPGASLSAIGRPRRICALDHSVPPGVRTKDRNVRSGFRVRVA